ncbi:MAG: glutathione S-transferase family protein [Minwuiales bacterium]|nr:glutathione S-transferase family protein [Minwuiales bacterium]
MGMLVEGTWTTQMPDPRKTGGRFVRADAAFRDWVTADGSSGFKTEAGRYHLYVSHACPWAHRTMIYRKLKGLEDAISVTVVEPLMLEQGWEIAAGNDPVNGAACMHQVYAKAKPDYTGRCSVPVLWDKQTQTIVSNESSEIIRMFNSAFDAIGDPSLDFYPEPLRAEIDAVNELTYENINNGVYKNGFATAQAAYEDAFDALFDALDQCEARLAEQRYLVGNRITEADWRLFPTLVRFDPVYVGHFKCNLRRIADYPNLSNYTRELYQVPGVAETVHLDHIKTHYYASHRGVNPTGIVPKGPEIDYSAPHDRDRFIKAAAAE